MWNALRRGNNATREAEEECAKPVRVEDADPMLVVPEEIPFIEVGPHKSIEASPSVLAFSPASRQTVSAGGVAASRAATDGPARLAGPTETPPKPRTVPFRAVFLATPEMEAETPQNDPLARLITFL
jgi:hypothetical protein